MKTCQQCDHQQDTGNFCENCGHPLDDQVVNHEEIAATAEAKSSQLDEFKAYTKNYYEYYVSLLKNLNLSLKQNDNSFIQGLISLLILTITYSLGIYFMLNGLIQQAFGAYNGLVGGTHSLPFFSIFYRLLIVYMSIVLAGLFAFWVIIKLGKVNITFKTIIAQYGALSVPFTIASTLMIFTGLIDLRIITIFLIFISLITFTLIAPVILSLHHLQENNSKHYIYLSICSFILTNVIILIMYKLLIENIIVQLNGVII